MEVKCEFCGSMIPDNAPKCPNCGATNENMHRSVDGTPKTIAELEQWYKDRNLPPYEVTRFFIGIDTKEAKAFGIYKDGDKYVVYKNKSSGERAVRYNGADESYAVNEIYLKLKSEILSQKAHNVDAKKKPASRPYYSGTRLNNRPRRRSGIPIKKIILLLVIAFVLVCIGFACFGKDGSSTSYYNYNGVPYVFYNGNYYNWDYDDQNYEILPDDEVPQDLYDNSSSYQINDYNDEVPYFQSPSYSNSGSSYDWDSGDSWNSNDSWDNDSFYSWDNDDDSFFSWDSNDSWDSGWDSGGWDSGGWDSGGWDSDW